MGPKRERGDHAEVARVYPHILGIRQYLNLVQRGEVTHKSVVEFPADVSGPDIMLPAARGAKDARVKPCPTSAFPTSACLTTLRLATP